MEIGRGIGGTKQSGAFAVRNNTRVALSPGP
jgi:hypothetical protein